ncbi:MAG: hypothetical protein MZV64_62985 [Ignavibacteriales bacterium]|nr:hypothetical protein [Ignavibacteriales bacterium]
MARPHLVGLQAGGRDGGTSPALRPRHLVLGPCRLLLRPALGRDRVPGPGLRPVQGHLPPAGRHPDAGLPPAVDRQRRLPGRSGRRRQGL